jgi:hypothetical protein
MPSWTALIVLTFGSISYTETSWLRPTTFTTVCQSHPCLKRQVLAPSSNLRTGEFQVDKVDSCMYYVGNYLCYCYMSNIVSCPIFKFYIFFWFINAWNFKAHSRNSFKNHKSDLYYLWILPLLSLPFSLLHIVLTYWYCLYSCHWVQL